MGWRASAFIKKHFTRYFGVPLRDIEKMMLKKTPSQIADILGVTNKAFTSLLPEGFLELRRDIRKKVAIELFSMGITPERIVSMTFGLPADYPSQIKRVFKDIFGISFERVMGTDWASYVKRNFNYWIDFLGLIKGIDY